MITKQKEMLGTDYTIRDNLFRRKYISCIRVKGEDRVPWGEGLQKDVPLIGAELMAWSDVARHVEWESNVLHHQ